MAAVGNVKPQENWITVIRRDYLPIFRDQNLLPPNLANLSDRDAMTYILGHPEMLHGLIGIFRRNLDKFEAVIGADVLKNAHHWDREPDKIVVGPCNQSIGEIITKMVVESAKRVYGDSKPAAPAPAKASTGFLSGLLGRKEPPAPPKKPPHMVWLEMLQPALQFDWQLLLLKSYRKSLSVRHLRVLGETGLHCLRSAEAIAQLAEFPPEQLAQAQKLVGDNFTEMLSKTPMAIAGIVMGADNTDRAERWKTFLGDLHAAAGSRAWEVLAAGQSVVQACQQLKAHQMGAFGENLADMSAPAITAIQELATADKIKTFLESSQTYFGHQFAGFFTDDASAATVANMIAWIRAQEASRAMLMDLIPLHWRKLYPPLLE